MRVGLPNPTESRRHNPTGCALPPWPPAIRTCGMVSVRSRRSLIQRQSKVSILRHVENGDVEDVIWERAALSRIILSDEFCSLDDAKALKRGKAFGHAANLQSLKQNYGRGAPALPPCCARMPGGHAAAALPRKMNSRRFICPPLEQRRCRETTSSSRPPHWIAALQ